MAPKAKTTGVVMAAAIAGLMISGSAFADDQEKTEGQPAAKEAELVKCEGVNGCKAKGECGSADHGCAGMNSCKGKGWVKVTEADCKEKGGTVI